MLTRFEFERAFTSRASGLPSHGRHVLHVLAMRLDRQVFAILPAYQPSLTDLARDMGCDRRTAMRRLNRVEAAGWVVRNRPTVHDARTKHARTQYTLQLPPGYPQARGATTAELGAQDPGPRGETPPGLGASQPEARDTMPHRSSESSMSSDGDLDVIISEIAQRTGKTIGRAAAARIRGELLDKARGTISDSRAYLRRCILREPDPARWLPTPTPPKYSREKGFT